MNFEELCREAQHLAQPEKGELITRLLSDFDAPDYDVSDKEVLQRKAEMESGEVCDISHEELISGLQYVK